MSKKEIKVINDITDALLSYIDFMISKRQQEVLHPAYAEWVRIAYKKGFEKGQDLPKGSKYIDKE